MNGVWMREEIWKVCHDLCHYADETVWVGPAETLVDRLCAIALLEQDDAGLPLHPDGLPHPAGHSADLVDVGNADKGPTGGGLSS